MKLRVKITYVLAIFTILLIAAISILNEYFIMGSYKELQEQQKNISVKNVDAAINDMINRHEMLLTDWAYWDDTLSYIKGTNNDFAENEIAEKVFIDQKINYILVYDENYSLLSAKGYDFKNSNSLEIKDSLTKEIKNHINTSGVLEIDGEYIAFSTSNIYNSKGTSEGEGLLVFAHKIDVNCGKELTLRSNYDIKIEKHTDISKANVFEIENRKNYEIFINKEFLNTDNHLSFSFELSKDVEMLGVKNAYRLHIYSIITIILMGLVIRRLILKFVSRLEKISGELSNIRSLSDTEYRISVKGEDEVSILSSSINNMLDKILLMNNKLVEGATLDLLTGVYNRRTGLEKLEKTIRYTKKTNDDLTICFIDINDLKHVNDVYGHRIGDEYLKKVTEVVVRNIRDKDFVCRLGGDEFLIVFKGCSKEDAKKVINRINRDLEKINSQKAYEFSMSISKGIVSYTDGLDIDDFVEMADKRMYIDKTRYRNKRDGNISEEKTSVD